MNEQAKRIEKQMVQLVLTQSFFATLLLRLKIEENNAPWNPTACTDGVHIYWNHDFIKGLTDGEVRALLVHEVMHPALGHLWRIGTRDMKKANIAADHAVNLFIQSINDEAKKLGHAEPLPLPKNGCCDKKYTGMGMEEIYNLLPEPKKQYVGFGEFTKPKAGNGDKDEKGQGQGNTEADWKVAVIQAANAAKLCGTQSAALDRLVNATAKPQVPWQRLLENFVSLTSDDDYDWQKFDRRYIDEGWYFPTVYSERVGELAIIVDTSGSIGDDILSQFTSEVQELMHSMKPSKLVVYYADTEICGTEEFECGDKIVFKAKGGGGTDFAKPLKEVKKRGIVPQCLIYLTDLYGTFPKTPPPFPVIWVVTPGGDKREVPFGDIARMI
jgi:predicted metal-dependent peptidase